MQLEDVQKVAKLARIKLNDDEAKMYGQEITNILSWIEQLQDVDVSHISIQDLIPHEAMSEREDTAVALNRTDLVLKNAPKVGFDMFSVPKMVE